MIEIHILPNKDAFERMSHLDIIRSHFVAYATEPGMFCVAKNRFDGITRKNISESVVTKYINKYT